MKKFLGQELLREEWYYKMVGELDNPWQQIILFLFLFLFLYNIEYVQDIETQKECIE